MPAPNPTDIPLSHPDITDAEVDAVIEVLRSGRLSIGPQQEAFEEAVAERTGRAHGVAVSSGTAGLHLLMLALGVGPGDQVITTPFSFIASANCILMVGAEPVFVDVCPRSLNIDPAKVEAAINDRTRAVIGVEVFGNPMHMDRLERVCQRHEVVLIEDACEGMGGRLGERAIGGFGRASVFGFYPNKQVTTGEGGMIVTDDTRLAEVCQSLRNQGRDPHPPTTGPAESTPWASSGSWLSHHRLGYNYRLSEINAALGVVQMRRLDEMLDKRRGVAAMYFQHLIDCDDLILPTLPEEHEEAWSPFVFVVRLTRDFERQHRDRIIANLRRHGIGSSNYFPPIHLQPPYRHTGYGEGDFPICESASDRTIALPFFNHLDATQVELACHTLKVMIERERVGMGD